VLIAESSMKSKTRINDYNNFRMYNVRRVVFDTGLLARPTVLNPCLADQRSRHLTNRQWRPTLNMCQTL
jgi:hypothetical protein